MKKKPYISFVVVGRNDNYEHNFLDRFQKSLDSIVYLCEKYKLNSELIIVEWNPPEKSKRLYEKLVMEKHREYIKIRFIEVPAKIHNTLRNSDKVPLFEYIGKNIGIRRAHGEFVLITNPDMIFSNEIIRKISRRDLKKYTLYRADRFDLFVDVPSNLNSEKIEEFCEKNWITCWSARWGRYSRGLAFFKTLKKFLLRAIAKQFKRYSYLRYHGGAPGDFMLISKEGWERFSGFPEFKKGGGVMDSYGCVLSVAAGNKFMFMKGRIYHQFHKKGLKSMPKCDLEKYREDAKKILSHKGKMIKHNDSDWGLNEYKLGEKEF